MKGKHMDDRNQAVEVLQVAYIQEWKAGRGEVIGKDSINRLVQHVTRLAEITESTWVKKQCAAAIESLRAKGEGRRTSPIDRTIFHQIAVYYGHPELFRVSEMKRTNE